ncbi:glucose 1-dehydrogenase [Gammaproteobacteria bacterium]|jgi:NAD(P)-dependent dehydrogenase (short-subunit alcohol dehydrogenase family)|nr:glucose 1-dehydrogenase [Gammaproteobacteria bacterium]
MKDSLQGKVALVTGAGTGIGSATAKLLAAKGAAVLVTDFDDEAGQATTKAITDAGSEAVYLHADMSSPDDIGSMVATAVEKWGRLDCAVNNAGIAGILGASLADYPDDIFDKVISVNLKGVFLCMKHQINQMLTQDSGGAIVNVASAAGLIGLPNAAYTASKHGVVGMTKSAAIAYSKNRIRINSVCPGYIDTPAIAPALNAGEEVANALVAMHPIGRLGEADEIAEAIAWLCSDAASFMAGHAMAVDGGLVAK